MVSDQKTRLTRHDWVIASVETLRDHGPEALKVVKLAKLLGVTSGSFYWHFEDRAALRDAILEFWDTELTDRFIEQAAALDDDPFEQLKTIMFAILSTDEARYEHSLRVWAMSDPAVREAAKRVESKRHAHAGKLFREIGFDEKEASIRARIFIAFILGENVANLKQEEDWDTRLERVLSILADR